MKNKINLLALFIFTIANNLQAEEKLPPENLYIPQMNVSIDQKAFTTPLTAFLATATPQAGQQALVRFENGILMSMCPSVMNCNYKGTAPCPYYNQGISTLTALQYAPIFSTVGGSVIYYVNQFNEQREPVGLISSAPMRNAAANSKDDQNQTTDILIQDNEIINISLGLTGSARNAMHNYVFAAVKPKNAVWGCPESGIGVVKFDVEIIETENKIKKEEQQDDGKEEKKDEKEVIKRLIFNNLDAVTGIANGNRAVPITQAASINDGLASINGSSVNLYWDNEFGRLYIPLQVSTKDTASSDQGAHALLVGYLYQDKLVIHPVVSAHALNAHENNIIGAVGPNRSVSIHTVRVMHTSSGLAYLIVIGGNGSAQETESMVHALPLINKSYAYTNKEELADFLQDKEHGTIALEEDVPAVKFYDGKFMRFKGRVLQESNAEAKRLYTDTNQTVRVGSNTQLPGSICDILVLQDCVYVLVATQDEKKLFYSQALFQPTGRISSWTCWQPLLGPTKDTFALSFEPSAINCLFLQKNQAGLISSIAKQWVTPEITHASRDNYAKYLITLVDQEFDPETGGIHGIFDLGLKDHVTAGQNRETFLAFSGYKKLMLVKAKVNELAELPVVTKVFDGSLNTIHTPASACLSLEGGALNEIGSITSVAVVNNEYETWLMVGGSGGIAILAKPDGSGWHQYDGIGNNFAHWSSRMTFKKIGNHRLVKKIISDDRGIYILTHNNLERIYLTAHTIKNNTCKVATLADRKTLKCTFYDAVVAGPFALLATSNGLLRVGNNKNIFYAINADDANWTEVEIPYGQDSKCISSLFTLSSSANQDDFGRNGQVYVLNSSIATHCSDVYRFFIKDVYKYGVTDETICLIPDYSFQDHKTSFINYAGFRNHYLTDGLFHLSARGGKNSFLHALPAFVGGKQTPSEKGYFVMVNKNSYKLVQAVAKDYATNNWLVGGDFGLCVYQ